MAVANAGDGGDQSEPEAQMLSDVVVTAGRTAQTEREVAAQMEVVSSRDLDRTSGFFAVDALKKNASVDVIQYPGGLSGIGMRGFRPEFSGTSQRVLVLVDGRPAGVTNLGNLPSAGVERVEVLKGSASAVYGASAMGGVVNFITRRSDGPIGGTLSLGGGSFDTLLGDVGFGGAIGGGFDFDVALRERQRRSDFRVGSGEEQLGEFRQGGGVKRPNTTFQNRSLFARLGYQLADDWRADMRLGGFFTRGTDTPGGESAGTDAQGSNDTDAYSADLVLAGGIGAHELILRAFSTREDTTSFDVEQGERVVVDRARDTRFQGLQLRDSWEITRQYAVTFGADYERATNENFNFDDEGTPTGPFFPDDLRETLGVYTEVTTRQFGERLIVNVGGRYDHIRSEIRETRFRPDLEPGSSSFDTFNPRAGIVFMPDPSGPWRLHGSAGRGFVAPQARQVAGRTEEFSGDQRIVGLSNPDLDPERSTTYDLGVGYAAARWSTDVTVFRTDVDDKIESVIVTNTPELRESSWVNASSARADGVEMTLQAAPEALFGIAAARWNTSLSSTYYFEREQDLPSGVEPLRNIARFKINAALDADIGRFGGRVLLRHVRGMQDRDFSTDRVFTGGEGGLFTYDSLTVLDLDMRWRLTPRQAINLQVDNLFDRYYFEKNDFPAAGRAFYVRYRVSF